MLNRSCLLLLLALSLPNYCLAAKPLSVPMPVAQELPVELIESQQEIAVSVPNTASAVGMQFGLIGALIGSAVQNSQAKKAEESVVPLRDLLVDYRFNQKMQESLQAKLVSDGISPHPVLTVLPTVWEAHDAQQTAKLPPYALVLTPAYAVDNQFTQLTVSLRAQVVDRTVKSNGKIKVVPRFNRLYAFQFPLQGARSADPVQDWVALGSAGIAQLLDQGIAQTTDMLVQDFSAEGRAAWETKPKGQSVTVGGNVYEGMPVRQGEGWAWVRTGKGWMQNVQGYQPLTVGVQPAIQVPAAATVATAATAAAPTPATSATTAATATVPAQTQAPVAIRNPGAIGAKTAEAAPAPSPATAEPALPAPEEAPAATQTEG